MYWCPGAEAPGHQYPQCWFEFHCIELILYRNLTITLNKKLILHFDKNDPVVYGLTAVNPGGRLSTLEWTTRFGQRITVMSQWARCRLKSPASRLFTEPFIQAQIEENIKAPRHWLCAGNSPVTGEFLAQMASNAENISVWWHHHGEESDTVFSNV